MISLRSHRGTGLLVNVTSSSSLSLRLKILFFLFCPAVRRACGKVSGCTARLTSVASPEGGLVKLVATESPQSQGLVVDALVAEGQTQANSQHLGTKEDLIRARATCIHY